MARVEHFTKTEPSKCFNLYCISAVHSWWSRRWYRRCVISGTVGGLGCGLEGGGFEGMWICCLDSL